jgi:hypothetical protein
VTRGLFIATVDEQGRVHPDHPTEMHQFNMAHFAGHEVELEIRKRRSKRSLKQNSAYHASIQPLAEFLGYTVEELKLVMLGGCFGWKDVKGAQLPERMHTSDLNTEEFSDLMAYTMQIAAEHDILILDPSQWKAERKRQQRGAGRRGAGGVTTADDPDRRLGVTETPAAPE